MATWNSFVGAWERAYTWHKKRGTGESTLEAYDAIRFQLALIEMDQRTILKTVEWARTQAQKHSSQEMNVDTLYDQFYHELDTAPWTLPLPEKRWLMNRPNAVLRKALIEKTLAFYGQAYSSLRVDLNFLAGEYTEDGHLPTQFIYGVGSTTHIVERLSQEESVRIAQRAKNFLSWCWVNGEHATVFKGTNNTLLEISPQEAYQFLTYEPNRMSIREWEVLLETRRR
jgi:hypothetical protein